VSSRLATNPVPDAEFSVAPGQITADVLQICEKFVRQASPLVHSELRQFLREHGYEGDLGWLIDSLGFTTQDRSEFEGRPGVGAWVSGVWSTFVGPGGACR
jgi:hypothetical protein